MSFMDVLRKFGLGGVFGSIVFLLTQIATAEQATLDLDAQLALGAEVYAQGCAICHFDGAGNPSAPDIKGSSYLLGGPEKLITITLRGQGNVSVVNGKKFNGQMPRMDYLTDDEVAAVAAYVLANFSQERKAVSPALVKSLRDR